MLIGCLVGVTASVQFPTLERREVDIAQAGASSGINHEIDGKKFYYKGLSRR